MKKIILSLLVFGVVMAGCSESETPKETAASVEESTHKEKKAEPKEVPASFGDELILVEKDYATNETVENARVQISNFRVETTSANSEANDSSEDANESEAINKVNKKNIEYLHSLSDYIVFDMLLENTSGSELEESFFTHRDLVFYDTNGAQIDVSPSAIYPGTYSSATLRPNGSLKGTIVLAMPEGQKIAEILLPSAPKDPKSADTFVFKVGQ